MESDSDSMANLREKDSTALSIENDSVSHKSQQPVLSPASSVQNVQSNDVTLDQIKDSLNEADEQSFINFSDDYLTQIKSLNALIQKLRSENEELKVKQAVSDEKDKRSRLYEDFIGELREKCSIKDKQLMEKEKQLVEKARLIELLEAKCAEKESHLQSNKIHDLQAECDKKDKLLADKENFIAKLQAENNEKNVQLQSKSSEINKLQITCNNKDSQCTEKDNQMTATLDRLKNLGMSMHDSSELVDTLLNCGLACFIQAQYVEALTHWQNAIELEKATQNRSSKMAQLFSNKSGCYCLLHQYPQAVDAANLAIQYDPIHKMALNNRGVSYMNLKQYSNARQDLEKVLQLDPTYGLARDNLKRLQELIDASTSQ